MVDFSVPYFHSGISLLAAPKVKTDIPLLAFLMPFSPELWIAVFIWLNLTAIAVAIYEWLSPFGLNPWGRQRSKNFSLSSGECRSINVKCAVRSLFWMTEFIFSSLPFEKLLCSVMGDVGITLRSFGCIQGSEIVAEQGRIKNDCQGMNDYGNTCC